MGIEVEEGPGRAAWPERKEHRKGSGPTANTVSCREAHLILPTAQAYEAITRVMLVITLTANIFEHVL